MARHLKSKADFDEVLSQPNKLSVIDFTATWCGPCKAISPHIDELARTHTHVNVCKCVENEARELVDASGISGFPTFRFYVNGRQVHEIVGADLKGVLAAVEKYQIRGDVDEPVEYTRGDKEVLERARVAATQAVTQAAHQVAGAFREVDESRWVDEGRAGAKHHQAVRAAVQEGVRRRTVAAPAPPAQASAAAATASATKSAPASSGGMGYTVLVFGIMVVAALAAWLLGKK